MEVWKFEQSQVIQSRNRQCREKSFPGIAAPTISINRQHIPDRERSSYYKCRIHTGIYWPCLLIFFQHLEHWDFVLCSWKMHFQSTNLLPSFRIETFLSFFIFKFWICFLQICLLKEKELFTYWHLLAMVVDIFSAPWALRFSSLFLENAFSEQELAPLISNWNFPVILYFQLLIFFFKSFKLTRRFFSQLLRFVSNYSGIG